MKRLIVLFVLLFFLPAVCSADLPDITDLSFDELIELRDSINLALLNSEQWQEVTVPPGLWKIGEDIPAGHWTIKLGIDHGYTYVWYFEKPDEFGRPFAPLTKYVNQALATEDFHPFDKEYIYEIDFDMKEGMYFYCENTTVFTPYSGKPSLQFK